MVNPALLRRRRDGCSSLWAGAHPFGRVADLQHRLAQGLDDRGLLAGDRKGVARPEPGGARSEERWRKVLRGRWWQRQWDSSSVGRKEPDRRLRKSGEPQQQSRPSAMMPIRSPSRSASSMKWVVRIMTRPAFSDCTVFQVERRENGSMPEVGCVIATAC